jgi:peptidoglycan-associated lipoprotein
MIRVTGLDPAIHRKKSMKHSKQINVARQSVSAALLLLLTLGIAGCANNTAATGNTETGGRVASGAPGSPADFSSTVGNQILFESDSAELTATAQVTLDNQAQWLSRYPRYQVIVEGHADERGTREYNFALGARRAETTRSYLAAKGIATSRMRIVSYGKERPVSVCDNISCWSQNRRSVTNLGASTGS